MVVKNELLWTYKELRGLYTNKVVFHYDRESFLEYGNVENLVSFERAKRAGTVKSSHALSRTTAILTGGNINSYANFHYFDKSDSTYKYNLCLFAPKQFFIYDGTTITEVVLPSMPSISETLISKWKAVTLKNRLLICTSIHSYYNIPSNTAFPYDDNKYIIKVADDVIPDDLLTILTYGDIICLDGREYKIKKYGGSLSGYDLIELQEEYSGYRTSDNKFSGGAIFLSRPLNFIIYDPNDKRYKVNSPSYSPYITRCGVVRPATQLIVDTEVFTDEDGVNGFVYRGNTSTPQATLEVKKGDTKMVLENCSMNFGLIGKYVYVREDEYAVLKEFKIIEDTVEGIGYYKHTMIVDKEYQGPNEVINGTTTGSYRWVVYYGNISNDVGYKYCYAYYNSHTGHMSNHSPIVEVLSPFKCFNVRISDWDDLGDNKPNNKYDYDTIILFRSEDGGVIMKEIKRIESNFTGSYYDKATDDMLGVMVAENFTNEPPPELIDIEEYRGRIFGINVNKDKLYFSCDETQIAYGRAEESWPVTNYINVPTADGEFKALKKAGNFLYIATNRNLYVLQGYNESTYTLEKIIENAGIVNSNYITEYQGALSEKVGIFFLSNGGEAWVVTPDGKFNVGYSIQNKLQSLMGDNNYTIFVQRIITTIMPNTSIMGLSYSSNKTRNYIGIFYRSAINQQLNSYIYDCDANAWYEHTFLYATLSNQELQDVVCNSSIGGYSIPIGVSYYAATNNYKINLYSLYNSQSYTDCGELYSASIKTSWIDFDNLSVLKAPIITKIYTNSTNSFSASLAINCSAVDTLQNISFNLDQAPFLEMQYEQIADFKAANKGYLACHNASIKIDYPYDGNYTTIYNINILFEQLSKEAINR